MSEQGRASYELNIGEAIHEARAEVLDTESPLGMTREQADQLVDEGVLTCEMVVFEYARGPAWNEERFEQAVLG